MVDVTEFERKARYWDQVRNAIIHEDNLVNHRLTWLLTVEGFLIGGFALVETTILAGKLSPWPALVTQLILAVLFLLAIWVCLIVGTMIAAAYGQIGQIYVAWVKEYPNEPHDKTPLPEWLWKGGALPTMPPSTTSPSTPRSLPVYPQLIGTYEYSYWLNTQRIPVIFLTLNAIACAICLVFGVAGFWAGSLGPRPVSVELERTMPDGVRFKASFEGDESRKELLEKLHLILQQPTTPIAHAPITLPAPPAPVQRP